jgi:phospholipid/cholesterol/gamma-HCH transport system permease protein
VILQSVEKLGNNTLYYLRDLGRMGIFLLLSLRGIVRRPFRFAALIKEIRLIGAHSTALIFFTAAFTGMVLGLQGYYTRPGRFGHVRRVGNHADIGADRCP